MQDPHPTGLSLNPKVNLCWGTAKQHVYYNRHPSTTFEWHTIAVTLSRCTLSRTHMSRQIPAILEIPRGCSATSPIPPKEISCRTYLATPLSRGKFLAKMGCATRGCSVAATLAPIALLRAPSSTPGTNHQNPGIPKKLPPQKTYKSPTPGLGHENTKKMTEKMQRWSFLAHFCFLSQKHPKLRPWSESLPSLINTESGVVWVWSEFFSDHGLSFLEKP